MYSGPYFDGSEIQAAINTLREGAWYPAGKEVATFERQFSEQFGFESSLMVNSGSSANLVMLAALKQYFGWKDGDEIIVSVVGFPTTINPIIQNGLKPKFVDITWDDLNWDLDQVRNAIGPRTVGVFSSPVLGNSYDMDKLLDICITHDLELIADNCDSLGSKWRGQYLTKYATASSCSFYPAHHITTLEGGMVSSNIEEVVKIARQFAWWGRDCYCVGACNLLSNGTCGKRFDTWLDGYDDVVDHRYVFSQIGYNLKPLDLQGSIGQIQLKKFDAIHALRRYHYQYIKECFFGFPDEVRVVEEGQFAETSWFGVPIVCTNPKVKRLLQQQLEDAGIQTRNYFAGNILMHPAYRHLGDAKDYPNALEVLKKVFFLGTSPSYSSSDLFQIQDTIYDFLGKQDIVIDGHGFCFAVD